MTVISRRAISFKDVMREAELTEQKLLDLLK